MNIRTIIAPAAVLLAAAAGACDTGVGPEPEAQLAAVYPAAGSAGVDVNTTVTITFTHPMMSGMEFYVALQEGDVTGLMVAGSWSWSDDRRSLTFTPAAPLAPRTRYTIHVGGGLRTATGQPMGFGTYGMQMGGQWATHSMMGGGLGPSMMGSGWRNANGTYGMFFTFTSA